MTSAIFKGHLVREPRDDAYRSLIRAVGHLAARILLVWGDPARIPERGRAILAEMEPWCRLTEQRGEWPGTRLLSGTVTVKEYEASRELIKIMESTTIGLYEQDDLAFLRADGSPILYVIAHEGQAHLAVNAHER